MSRRISPGIGSSVESTEIGSGSVTEAARDRLNGSLLKIEGVPGDAGDWG